MFFYIVVLASSTCITSYIIISSIQFQSNEESVKTAIADVVNEYCAENPEPCCRNRIIVETSLFTKSSNVFIGAGFPQETNRNGVIEVLIFVSADVRNGLCVRRNQRKRRQLPSQSS